MKDESVISSAPTDMETRQARSMDVEAKPFIVLVIVAGVLLLITESIVVHTAPLENLLMTTKWSVIGTIHGVFAATGFISLPISVYLSYRLLIGKLRAFRDLQIASALAVAACVVTILFGNWIYIGYRAPGMVKDYFLENSPALHWIFFEFKEEIALYTVPLGVAAAFILHRYGPSLTRHPWLRTMVFILLGLVFIYFLITFGLGAAITKVKPV